MIILPRDQISEKQVVTIADLRLFIIVENNIYDTFRVSMYVKVPAEASNSAAQSVHA